MGDIEIEPPSLSNLKTRSIVVFYATETGNAEVIARQIAERAISQNNPISAKVLCLKKFPLYFNSSIEGGHIFNNNLNKSSIKSRNFQNEPLVLFVVSTTGNGDPPAQCIIFQRWLTSLSGSKYLKNVSFSMLALGDSNYDNFCASGWFLRKKLLSRGANEFYSSAKADDATGLEPDVEKWMNGLWKALNNQFIKWNNSEIGDKSVDSKTKKMGNLINPQQSLEINDNIQQLQHPIKIIVSSLGLCENAPGAEFVKKFKKNNNSVIPLLSRKYNVLDSDSHTNLNSFSQVDSIKAKIVSAKYLSARNVSKPFNHKDLEKHDVIHLDLNVPSKEWAKTPGESIGIIFRNSLMHVNKLCALLSISGRKRIRLEPVVFSKFDIPAEMPPRFPINGCTVMEAFERYYDISSPLKPRIYRILAEFCSVESEVIELLKLSSNVELRNEYHELLPSLYDVLKRFPSCKPTLDILLNVLPPLQIRHYSLASSPLKNENLISICFTVVKFNIQANEKFQKPKSVYSGQCTSWLQRKASPYLKDKVTKESEPIDIIPSLGGGFYMPKSENDNMIFICTGAGIAPFKGMLEHIHLSRKLNVDLNQIDKKNEGERWMFFGSRYKSRDFLYEPDLNDFLRAKTLTRLVTAFSRDQPEKIYIQDRLIDHADKLIELLFNRNSYLYICGGIEMCNSSHDTLKEIIIKHKKLTNTQVDDLLQKWRDSNRYFREIWM